MGRARFSARHGEKDNRKPKISLSLWAQQAPYALIGFSIFAKPRTFEPMKL